MSNKTLPDAFSETKENSEENSEEKERRSVDLSGLYEQIEELKKYANSLREENKRLSELVKTDLNEACASYENPQITDKDIEELVKERDGYKSLALAKIKDMILSKVKEAYPDCEYDSVDSFPEEFHRLVCAHISPATAYKVISEIKERGADKPVSMGGVNSNSEGEKDFYTSAEADKLTKKQLSNPKIMNAVLKSMVKW